MADEEIKVYGFCENKCRREVMLKETVEALINEINTEISSLNSTTTGLSNEVSTMSQTLDEVKTQAYSDFILINQQELTFTDKVATISDERITSDSLADVYFTSDSIAAAEQAIITVETTDGAVVLTSTRDVTSTLKATIRIKLVA